MCPSPSQEDDDDFDPCDLSFNPNEEEDLNSYIPPATSVNKKDRQDDADVKVEEELCPSPPSQEDDDDFDPFDLAFSPDEEDDLECCIRPVLDLKSILAKETPGSRVNNKNQEKIILTTGNKLRRKIDRDRTGRNGDIDKNLGSGQGHTKSFGERDFRLVLDRLSKKDLAKWKVPLERKRKVAKRIPQQRLDDDFDDNPNEQDDEYTLPSCNSSSEDNLEFAPAHKQMRFPVFPKGRPSNRHLDGLDEFAVFDPVTHAKRYRCPDCSKIIRVPTHFKEHRLIHTGEKPCVCATCGAAFRRKRELLVHLERLHSTEKKEFFCDQCPKSFPVRYLLMTHRRIHLMAKKPIVYVFCPKCPKQFKNRRYLNRHVVAVHDQVSEFRLHVFT
ncbi:zinc finger protein 37 [Folsomia candida]|uniref:zinc finger protein 37 n=1 Tax=Folsomia candida TaxID=158441 RepID=UPI001604D1E0|nr:zinc finger protein 37 [Folsomia candida]